MRTAKISFESAPSIFVELIAATLKDSHSHSYLSQNTLILVINNSIVFHHSDSYILLDTDTRTRHNRSMGLSVSTTASNRFRRLESNFAGDADQELIPQSFKAPQQSHNSIKSHSCLVLSDSTNVEASNSKRTHRIMIVYSSGVEIDIPSICYTNPNPPTRSLNSLRRPSGRFCQRGRPKLSYVYTSICSVYARSSVGVQRLTLRFHWG